MSNAVLSTLIADIQAATLETQKIVFKVLTDAKVSFYDGGTETGFAFILDKISDDLVEQLSAIVDEGEFDPV